MSQDVTPVTETRDESTAIDVPAEPEHDEPDDMGPGASEGNFAVLFGSGFAAGMMLGGIVGVALNSLALAIFGGFILGTVIGTVLAARG